MTTSNQNYKEAYVWIWLPGKIEPVVAGKFEVNGKYLTFNYGKSYLEREDEISIYKPELPLQSGILPLLNGLNMPNSIRDSPPEWGRRVIINRKMGLKWIAINETNNIITYYIMGKLLSSIIFLTIDLPYSTIMKKCVEIYIKEFTELIIKKPYYTPIEVYQYSIYLSHTIAISRSIFTNVYNQKTFSIIKYNNDLKLVSLNNQLTRIKNYNVPSIKYTCWIGLINIKNLPWHHHLEITLSFKNYSF